MKTVILYRKDFKEANGIAFFNDVLNSLDIPEKEHETINEVKLIVAGWFPTLEN